MIWNPWKALRAAEQEVYRLRNLLAEENVKYDRLQEECNDVRRAERELRLRASLADDRIKRLEAEMSGAHFRNPKNGRIGRKGERFA